MLQNYYPQKDLIEIQKQFGSGFAESLAALAPDQWHGPVLSGYGVHLVIVQEVIESPPPQLAEVRARVEQDWKASRSEQINEQFYDKLREQYTVIIEQPAAAEGDSSRAERIPAGGIPLASASTLEKQQSAVQ